MSFTDQLWEEIEPIYDHILNIPFNQQLLKGTLDEDKFVFYLKQDSYYLADFTRALSLTGLRADQITHVEDFLEFALGAVKVERALHEHYFEKFDVPEDIEKSPTCFNYTNFLLRTASLDDLPVAVAAVLPCFWIYREVGMYINDRANDDNPYSDWIETYSSETFSKDVDRAIEITNEVADTASSSTRKKMKQAFDYSTRLEWMFWQSAYRKEQWPPEQA
jgi:thiaminase/transcriptional activator TenA